jgi:molybdate transport system substrate-binding protein
MVVSLRLIGLVVLAALAGCGGTGDAAPERAHEITVAAASDLRPAFEELGAAFSTESGVDVTFSFGSSGQLREQIINGAPFDLFASANVAFVDAVVAAGRGVEATRADYAYGRIVLWSRTGVERPATVEDLTDPRYRRIAIANPSHAPYGLAAQQALQRSGIHDEVAGRLVYGENISDTFRIAQSGNADAAIIALSLAIADGSEYELIPDDLHDPLRQALVVTSTGARGDAATDFARFIGSSEGRTIMVRYGFVLPGEQQGG